VTVNGIALGTEQHALAEAVSGFLAHHVPRQRVRAGLTEFANGATPEVWPLLRDQGLLTDHLPEEFGGTGAGWVELAVTVEEAARALLPGPFLSTILTSAVLADAGASATPVDTGACALGTGGLVATATAGGWSAWCQLFSEPGAGSDLASVASRAVRVPGGWRLSGQKVWTSRAHEADWAVCLARTDPDTPGHGGLSCFLVDMHAGGVDVRPLRQANGSSAFNEVFLSDVFVPDDCLVGEPGQGWAAARTTLANERVSIAGKVADGWDALAELAGRCPRDGATTVALGHLAATNHALSALMLRSVLMRLSGLRSGAGSSVLKVAAAEHHRALATVALDLLGPAGATVPDEGSAVASYLAVPAKLIGGGTMEIQLNVIAERVLGLPRDVRGTV
jgi:alkylation response protein AidB-like acyl-CoA dehydrogenase